MTTRSESDEKYILELAAEVLGEPDWRWQHRFPTLQGDPGADGRARQLPVDGYFPRHRLVIEYWEKQHSAPVPIMDDGMTVSGVSRGHQRRLYDLRRQEWAQAHGLRFTVLDYRGFQTDEQGRLLREPARDRQTVAQALQAAGAVEEPSRHPFDLSGYLRHIASGCFICRLVSDDPSMPRHGILWKGKDAIAFLNLFPTVYGYALVAPVDHVEQVTGDLTLHKYLALQRVVHSVAEAVRLALKPERVYVLSLGSQQANAHVHWHIVPCPPGVPPEQQQLALIDPLARGVLTLTAEEEEQLLVRLRAHLPRWMREREH